MARQPTISIRAVQPRLDWAVWAVAASLLLAGWAVSRTTAEPEREITALDGAVSLILPTGWSGTEHEDSYSAGPAGLGEIIPSITVTRLAVPDGGVSPFYVDLQMARIEQATADTGVGYRVLSTAETEAFGGHPSSWTYYAIVREPPRAGAGAAVLPVVVQGVDVLVTTEDGQAFKISASAPVDEFSIESGPIGIVMESLQIHGVRINAELTGSQSRVHHGGTQCRVPSGTQCRVHHGATQCRAPSGTQCRVHHGGTQCRVPSGTQSRVHHGATQCRAPSGRVV